MISQANLGYSDRNAKAVSQRKFHMIFPVDAKADDKAHVPRLYLALCQRFVSRGDVCGESVLRLWYVQSEFLPFRPTEWSLAAVTLEASVC